MDFESTFRLSGPSIIHKDFGDETVVANLDTGIFFSLGGAGSDIWMRLVAGYSPAEVVACFEGGNDIAAIVREFVSSLLDEGLILASLEPAPGKETSPAGVFARPTIERFDDLQGLLLIDPIHDVSEVGWPTRQDTLG